MEGNQVYTHPFSSVASTLFVEKILILPPNCTGAFIKINCSIRYEFNSGCSYSISLISFFFPPSLKHLVHCCFKESRGIKWRGSWGFVLFKHCLAGLEFHIHFRSVLLISTQKGSWGLKGIFLTLWIECRENWILTVASPFIWRPRRSSPAWIFRNLS